MKNHIIIFSFVLLVSALLPQESSSQSNAVNQIQGIDSNVFITLKEYSAPAGTQPVSVTQPVIGINNPSKTLKDVLEKYCGNVQWENISSKISKDNIVQMVGRLKLDSLKTYNEDHLKNSPNFTRDNYAVTADKIYGLTYVVQFKLVDGFDLPYVIYSAIYANYKNGNKKIIASEDNCQLLKDMIQDKPLDQKLMQYFYEAGKYGT